jgi:hypothetical protein
VRSPKSSRSAEDFGMCGLTFELSRPAEADAGWRRKDVPTLAWSRQTVAAVAGRRLSEGLGVTFGGSSLVAEPVQAVPPKRTTF